MSEKIALRAAYLRGVSQALPFILVIVPFGMLFGVAGMDTGMSIAQVMGFTILVIAGASQFTAVQLMNDHAPVLVVVVTALAVNLRMAMYSAALAPHLGAARRWHKVLISYFMIDQSVAIAAQAYEKAPERPLAEKLALFAGACTPTCIPWVIATLAGAVLGKAIPQGLALDFAVPVTFLAMIAPMLRSVPHLAAAVVSVLAALALSFLPSGTGILIAAVLAMAAGAQTELWLARRAGK